MSINIILDLEFDQSGIPNIKKEIIQIGAVKLDENHKVLGEFSSYVKPQYTKRVTPKCTSLTGITYSELQTADTLEICLERFLSWIGNEKNVVVHSWSDADLHQLKGECREKGIKQQKLEVLFDNWSDFQYQFMVLLNYQQLGSQLSLKNALHSVDIEFDGRAHDALIDAENTAKLFQLSKNKKEFVKRAEAVRSLFSSNEICSTTLGAMFPTIFQTA